MNFDKIRKEMEKTDDARESIIKESRSILKASKQAIYAIHRNDLKEAKKLISEAKKEKIRIEKKIKRPELRTGGFSNACEEFAEAVIFLSVIETGKVPSQKSVGVSNEEYLGGIADLTGELGRRAVLLGTERDTNGVKKIRDLVDEIFGEFVKFNFRNGDLRRKYDAIKYNLQKIEKVLYDLKV